MVITVVPAAQAGWDAVESVIEAEASSRNCSCQFHVLSHTAAKATDRSRRRELLREQVAALEPPRGLIALDAEGEPVGWCGVEPRTRLQHVIASRLVANGSPEPLDDVGVWAVYCLLVPKHARRRGIAATMLASAIEHARTHGARAIEGYPIDTARRGGSLPPGFSTGTVAMFEREGLQPIAALPSGRTLMHRTI